MARQKFVRQVLKIKYRGGPGDENAFIDERKEWGLY